MDSETREMLGEIMSRLALIEVMVKEILEGEVDEEVWEYLYETKRN